MSNLNEEVQLELDFFDFAIEKSTVTAKSRALKAEYTLELAQDLKAIHGDEEVTISMDYGYADDVYPTIDNFDLDDLFTLQYEPMEAFVYKFREDELIDEFIGYVDSTYAGHYGKGGLQSAEIIVDRGHGMGFFAGNIDKYNDRYGKKGDTPEEWRKDIMKTIHYSFLKLYEHDRIYGGRK